SVHVCQLVQVDFVVLDPVNRGETFTAHEGQAAEERQVTALMIQANPATRASALASGAAAGSLTLPGCDAASDALAVLLGPFIWSEFMQFHFLSYSSTLTRCETLL